MSQKKKTPRETAEERVRSEEDASREERVAEVAAEEESRRETERASQEAEKKRREAAKEAERLVEERKPIEDRLQSKIAEIAEDVSALVDLHDRHKKSLHESLDPEYNVRVHDGISFGASPEWARRGQDVRGLLRSYLEGSLRALYPRAKALEGTLAEADPLTPISNEDPAGRPAGDFPWEKLEEARRGVSEQREQEQESRRAQEAGAKIEALVKRRDQMRKSYGRAPSFNEVVAPEERTELQRLLSGEELERIRDLVEEVRREG